MREFYTLNVAGLVRELPICKVNDNLYIAAFVMFGDVELTVACAENLLSLAPEYDYMITAESKGIPLVFEMARQAKRNDYIVARKSPKLYMQDIIYSDVKSITTEKQQILCIGKKEFDMIKDKKILIVDDVFSTGESLAAVERLVIRAGGIVAGRMAVLAEGNAVKRTDIIKLADLPLFDGNGDIIS